MVDSNSETEPHLGKYKANQTLSGPLMFLSDITQDRAKSDIFQAVELVRNFTKLHEIHTAPTEIFSEDEQADITAAKSEEHSTDFRNEPKDHSDLESPIIKLLGALDEVESLTKTSSSFEAQTSKKDLSPNPSHEPSQDGTGDGIPFHEIEKTGIAKNAREDFPKWLSGTILEHTGHACFSETQKQDTEEMETSEPPAKRSVRRRMGMCGLGDRKRKFPFDGQHCRQGAVGRPMEGAQHLNNTVLEIDGFISVEQKGTSGPVCGDNEEVLKGMENNQAAEVEKGKGYAQKNSMNKCTSLINDDGTTEESSEENTVDPSKSISVENFGSVDEKITTEQVVLEHNLNLFEETSMGVGQTLLSPTIWKNIPMIKHELSVDASTSDCRMEHASCGEEPKFPVIERTNNGQDAGSNMKHNVLSEKQNDISDEIIMEAQVTQKVNCSLIYATVGRPEDSVVVSKKVQTGFQDSEVQTEGQCLLSMVTTEKPGLSVPDLSGSTENVLEPLLVGNLGNAADACMEIHNPNGHGKKDEPIEAVPESTEPDVDNNEEISKPTPPPTDQDNHMNCLLDHRAGDTSVTPTAAEQKDCNPTMTPAADELPQETGLSDPSLLYSMTDSQLHKIATSMELENQPRSGGTDHQEDATELVRGLIRELSSLNRTVMAAHREMELLRRGKLTKAPNHRICGPRPAEM